MKFEVVFWVAFLGPPILAFSIAVGYGLREGATALLARLKKVSQASIGEFIRGLAVNSFFAGSIAIASPLFYALTGQPITAIVWWSVVIGVFGVVTGLWLLTAAEQSTEVWTDEP